MSQAIRNQTNLPVMNLPCGSRNCCRKAGEFSYQEAKSAAISITTDEGDVVSLSSAGIREAEFALDYWQDDRGKLMNFTTTSLNAGSFNLSVEGDLNEEELHDIGILMEDLTAIAGDFFNGNLEEAMTGALNIGDLGSLATLSATFNHSLALSSSYLSENHPLPADDRIKGMADDFKELLKNEDQDLSYAEMMRAQWQQIKNFIEDIQQDAGLEAEKEKAKATAGDDSNLSPIEKMIEKINRFSGKHPRLAAFSAPLAHQAVNEAAHQFPLLPTSGLRDGINHEIMQKTNDWMTA